MHPITHKRFNVTLIPGAGSRLLQLRFDVFKSSHHLFCGNDIVCVIFYYRITRARILAHFHDAWCCPNRLQPIASDNTREGVESKSLTSVWIRRYDDRNTWKLGDPMVTEFSLGFSCEFCWTICLLHFIHYSSYHHLNLLGTPHQVKGYYGKFLLYGSDTIYQMSALYLQIISRMLACLASINFWRCSAVM